MAGHFATVVSLRSRSLYNAYENTSRNKRSKGIQKSKHFFFSSDTIFNPLCTLGNDLLVCFFVFFLRLEKFLFS